jgi:hypothetical protein
MPPLNANWIFVAVTSTALLDLTSVPGPSSFLKALIQEVDPGEEAE